jgi:hypothetical protein
MTYERFLKITLGLQVETERSDKLYQLGIDLIDYVDPYHVIINELMREAYGDEGYDWWSWFCWEADFGRKDWSAVPKYEKTESGEMQRVYDHEPRWGAHDAEGNPICYSFESTWEYLETNYGKNATNKS